MASKLTTIGIVLVSFLGCVSRGNAQSSVLTLAYQLTHVDPGEPYFSTDGKKFVYETTLAGHQQIFIIIPTAVGQRRSRVILSHTTVLRGRRTGSHSFLTTTTRS